MGYQGSDGRWHETEETAQADSAAQARVAGIDWGSWENKLKEAGGDLYEASDLQSLKTNIGYDRPSMSLDELYANRVSNYADRRSSDGGGGDEGGGGGGGGGGSVSSAWNTSGNEAERKARADALYGELLTRSQQGLAVNRNDPNIRQQVDPYAAQQEKARRNYISDTAESSGPYANLQGERRMAAERMGHAVGSMESELIGREVQAKRDEVAQALVQRQGMLSADQETFLRQQLAELDATLQRERMALDKDLGWGGLNQANDQFLRDLALKTWDRQNYWNDPLR